jgi:hypothetical protein
MPDQRAQAESDLAYVAGEIRKALDVARAEMRRQDAAVDRTRRLLEADMREMRLTGEALRRRHGVDRKKPTPKRTPAEKKIVRTLKFEAIAEKGRTPA